jgi:L-asparaginase
MRTCVTILATGGTIASTDIEGGARPTETGETLLPSEDFPEDVEVHIEQLAQRPSPEMDFEMIERLRRRIEERAADGYVITHGTDTIEETAYYLDLVLGNSPPVALTGAQRRPDQLSSDGPANVTAAIRAVSDARVREAGGVYVAFNDELHAARDVVKAHTWKLEAFESPRTGPVAVFDPRGLRPTSELGSRSVQLPVIGPPEGIVEMVSTGLGVNGRQLRRAVGAGADGLVLEATGLGNAPAGVADAVGDAIEANVPVVVTSQCYAGTVAPVYGSGGGQTLVDRGAIFADNLPAQKARIKLLLALAHTDSQTDIGTYFGRNCGSGT